MYWDISAIPYSCPNRGRGVLPRRWDYGGKTAWSLGGEMPPESVISKWVVSYDLVHILLHYKC